VHSAAIRLTTSSSINIDAIGITSIYAINSNNAVLALAIFRRSGWIVNVYR
jgi:hypothetical protein